VEDLSDRKHRKIQLQTFTIIIASALENLAAHD